jgi:hypothetical protein
MALDIKTKSKGRSGYAYPVADGEVINQGEMVGLALSTYATTDSRGYAIPLEDSAGVDYIGLAKNTVTGDTSADEPPEVEVDESGPILEHVTVTGGTGQADVGKDVHATDEANLKLAAASNISKVGTIVRYHSDGTFDVRMRTPEEYQNE